MPSNFVVIENIDFSIPMLKISHTACPKYPQDIIAKTFCNAIRIDSMLILKSYYNQSLTTPLKYGIMAEYLV